MRFGDVQVAVFDTSDGLRALENSCLHLGNPIDDGAVIDGVLTCPWHGWRYDVASGERLTALGRRSGVRMFGVRLEGDEVFVEVP